MIYYLGILCAIVLLAVIYRRHSRMSIADIPGPKAESFLLGNLREILQEGAAEQDFQWLKRFGSVVRFKGPFGEDRLMVSDPKALQYILHTVAYHFKKPSERREISRLINGRNLAWSEGDVHKRQRKVMLPAFGATESKALYPTFKSITERLVSRWNDILSADATDKGLELNIPVWLSRATLDAIGEAAFDYKFGELDNSETELGKAYKNLMRDTFGRPTTPQIFVDGISHYLPMWFIGWAFENLPFKRFVRMRQIWLASEKVAKQLLRTKGEALLEGKSNRDVMSLLVKANVSTNNKARLTDEELYAEMRVILFAGHETTSNSLTWILWELAKNPHIQARLRKEIRETEAAVRSRGSTELGLSDYEAMHYLQAVLKEGLRLHPAVHHIFREPHTDTVLPLSTPIQTISGKVIGEISVPRGTQIILSLAAYNRNQDLWGDDAHEFNPERWLIEEGKEKWSTCIGAVGGSHSIRVAF